MKVIDLRSDTVTQPTAAMREAMMAAEVGDDVYGEDPTVNRLQEHAAELLGKEAALFFPSGTMANQTAIHSLTRRGDVVLASRNCHILKYEAGAASALSGVQIKTMGAEGIFGATDVRENMHPDEQHFAPTTVVAVENTHNMAGGRVFPAELLEGVVKVARDAGLRLHLDGARLFNAAVASGTDPARLAEPFDTVSICLSKGLGAPVGSLVGASAERIHQLRRVRKMFGGGMRQAGFLAAAGIHALEHHVERLAEDHANARFLAEGLERLGLSVQGTTETNMVMFDFEDTMALVRGTRARHLLINPTAPGRFRAVTHLDVSTSDLEEALARLGAVLEEIPELMRIVIGAGAVGLALAARLARAGLPVLLVTRDAHSARRIDSGGIRVEDPKSGEHWCVPLRAVAGIQNAGLQGAERPLLICVRAGDTEALASQLAEFAPDVAVVSVQNGVDGDFLLASYFPRVIGAVWRQTCTRVEPDLVRFTGRGRVVVGLHPLGSTPEVDALAQDLRSAGFDVGISSRIAQDRWLKLCVNLMSAPNALIRREDHDSPPFVEVKVRLLEEARAVLAATGIEARSCDGRDRSLDQEIRHQRESLERGTSARRLPLYNQVWSSLRSDAPLEADEYHQRILELATARGIRAPTNARVLEKLIEAKSGRRGPECLRAAELLAP